MGTLGVLKKVAGTQQRLGIGVNVGGGVDATRRLKAVYGNPIHGPYCPRYRNYVKGVYASQARRPRLPAEDRLQGSGRQVALRPPRLEQPAAAEPGRAGTRRLARQPCSQRHDRTGGHCTRAGHPCMACTEKGYPDSFVPFVVR